MTGTLVAALAIIAGVYYVRPQLLGVAPKSAQPAVVAPADYAALLSLESTLENKSSRLLLLEH